MLSVSLIRVLGSWEMCMQTGYDVVLQETHGDEQKKDECMGG